MAKHNGFAITVTNGNLHIEPVWYDNFTELSHLTTIEGLDIENDVEILSVPMSRNLMIAIPKPQNLGGLEIEYTGNLNPIADLIANTGPHFGTVVIGNEPGTGCATTAPVAATDEAHALSLVSTAYVRFLQSQEETDIATCIIPDGKGALKKLASQMREDIVDGANWSLPKFVGSYTIHDDDQPEGQHVRNWVGVSVDYPQSKITFVKLSREGYNEMKDAGGSELAVVESFAVQSKPENLASYLDKGADILDRRLEELLK